MSRKIELHSNVTSELLLKNGFKEYPNSNKFYIYKTLYKPLIVLRIEIDLIGKEVIYDVIDRNTQSTYYPFWNNPNGNNNLVAIKAIKSFNTYINELQNKKILRRSRKYENHNNRR